LQCVMPRPDSELLRCCRLSFWDSSLVREEAAGRRSPHCSVSGCINFHSIFKMQCISFIALEQCQVLNQLRSDNEHAQQQLITKQYLDEIRGLRTENSDLRAALELKEIELERCRAVQDAQQNEMEKSRDTKGSDKGDLTNKSNRDRLEKVELQRKYAQLKKENEEKDTEIRQLKGKLSATKDQYKKQVDADNIKHQQEIFILQQLLKEARASCAV
jgi:hypothetical protein